MIVKFITKLLVVSLTCMLTSCFYPASANPVGDSFTYASNAIGSAENSVVPTAPVPAPQTTLPPTPTYTVPSQ